MRIMTFSKAKIEEKSKVEKFDKQLAELVDQELVYVLRDQNQVVGVLQYRLFWQKIPFIEHLYIDEKYRGNDYGTCMMVQWEDEMANRGYTDVMLSTEETETAKEFYLKIGYKQTGSFLPPNQKSSELMFSKHIKREC